MKKLTSKFLIILIISLIIFLALNPLKSFFRDFFLTFSAFGTGKAQQVKNDKFYTLSDSNSFIKDILEENKQLREICKLSSIQNFRFVTTEVVFRDPKTWNKRLIVNKGEEDGIEIGCYVAAASKEQNKSDNVFSIFGRVVQISRKTSEIATVFDGDFSISVFVGSKNTPAILSGGDEPKIEYFNPELLDNGINYVRTSKYSSFFPPFIPIGSSSVENPGGIFNRLYQLKLEPFADLSRTDFLIIILPEIKEKK